MRLPFLLLAATMSLAGPAHAFSFFSGTEAFDPPFWADIYVGYTTVTSDVTVGTPKSAALQQSIPYGIFYSQTIFGTSAGPINNGTFNGALDATHSAGTSTQQVVVTATLTGFGPGGADDPIFTYTTSPGAQIFGFNAGYATLNPTPGSISVFEQGTLTGIGFASFSLSQTGANLDGSLILTDGSATRTIQFVDSGLNAIYLSPSVSAVPLPPALPLFAFALLALGIFGYVRRAKDVTPAHGQAY
jgi:hypothetical protein